MQPARQQGFSLVELMVVVTTIAVLVLVSLPSMSDWILNSRTRSVAEAMQNGVRFAQLEAVRLHRITTFALSTGSWVVSYIPTSVDAGAGDKLNQTLQTSPAGNLNGVQMAPASSTSAPAVLAFNSLGRVSGAATTAGPFLPLAGDVTYNVTSTTGGSRAYNVIVSPAGKVRMCDPGKTFSATNPDGC
jgi:type IV fimbrial biogenesis protein FimT